jgi:hypothetical protein
MSTPTPTAAELERRKSLRIRLRSDLGIKAHKYEGRTFYVVKDPVSLRYYFGGVVGAAVGALLPGGDERLWSLVGMAAIMGGTMRSPLMSAWPSRSWVRARR